MSGRFYYFCGGCGGTRGKVLSDCGIPNCGMTPASALQADSARTDRQAHRRDIMANSDRVRRLYRRRGLIRVMLILLHSASFRWADTSESSETPAQGIIVLFTGMMSSTSSIFKLVHPCDQLNTISALGQHRSTSNLSLEDSKSRSMCAMVGKKQHRNIRFVGELASPGPKGPQLPSPNSFQKSGQSNAGLVQLV